MTEPTSIPDDELVSAHLDADADADADARVAAEPALRTRKAEFEKARALVASPVTSPSDVDRNGAIAAALEVFDSEVGGAVAKSATAGPSEIDEVAVRRERTRFSRQGPWLAVAAALVVLFIGVGTMLRASRTSRNAATTAGASMDANLSRGITGAGSVKDRPSAEQNKSESGDQLVSGLASTTIPTQDLTKTSGGPAASGFSGGDLGSISSPQQLRDVTELAYRASPTSVAPNASVAPTTAAASTTTTASAASPLTTAPLSAPTSPPASPSQLTACDVAVRGQDNQLGALQFYATATYRGRAALVLRYEVIAPNPSGTARIYALDRSTCETLDAQTIP